LSLGVQQSPGVAGAADLPAQQQTWPSAELAGHRLRWGSGAVCLARSGPGAAPFVSLSQLGICLQISSPAPRSSCPGWFCSIFHPLQPGLGEWAESALPHAGVALLLGIRAQRRDVAGSGRARSLSPESLAVVVPAPSLLPSSAGPLSPCFTSLLPGSQFSEGGRCDLGGGRLHQRRAPGWFPQV